MKTKRLTAFLTAFVLLVSFAMVGAASYTGSEKTPTQEETVITEEDTEGSSLPPETFETIEVSPSTTPLETPVVEEEEVEFPVALEVWNAMKAKGWSDEVCAGIIGNMMAECGGNTLNLNPYAIGDSGTSYGLCQWHNGRKNNLLTNYGESVQAQIDFLANELGDPNGYFSNPNSVDSVAYEFCIKFERPSNKEQKGIVRKALAQTAFEYFVGK